MQTLRCSWDGDRGGQTLGWRSSGRAASSGFSLRPAGKGDRSGRAAQPRRAPSALSAAGSRLRPRLALPSVPLLSSDLTASVALGKELPATRAEAPTSPRWVLHRRQISQLAKLHVSKSSDGAFPDVLPKKCPCEGRAGGVLTSVEVPNFCTLFQTSSSPAPSLSPSPSGPDQAVLCHLGCPPSSCLATVQPQRRCLCPTAAAHAKQFLRQGGDEPFSRLIATKFAFLLRGVTERRTRVSRSS